MLNKNLQFNSTFNRLNHFCSWNLTTKHWDARLPNEKCLRPKTLTTAISNATQQRQRLLTLKKPKKWVKSVAPSKGAFKKSFGVRYPEVLQLKRQSAEPFRPTSGRRVVRNRIAFTALRWRSQKHSNRRWLLGRHHHLLHLLHHLLEW